MSTEESLLKAILATVARLAFPPDELIKLVAPKAGGKKQLSVYNLCDGETPQAVIGKKANLDKGNLSRLISRWIDAGIVVRAGPDQYPLHLYRIPKDCLETNQARKSGRSTQ